MRPEQTNSPLVPASEYRAIGAAAHARRQWTNGPILFQCRFHRARRNANRSRIAELGNRQSRVSASPPITSAFAGPVRSNLSSASRTRFDSMSDAGVRLWLDGQLLIDDWTPHTFRTDFANDDAGGGAALRYSRRLLTKTRGPAQIDLSWSSPSQTLQTVPASRLYESPAGATGNVLRFGRRQPFADRSPASISIGARRRPATESPPMDSP